MKILLVDNTPLYRNILEQSLADLSDFKLSFAGSVAEAEALCRKEAFHFFIFAWQLADGEGIDLAKRLRDQRVLAPIVLLTSSPSEEVAVSAARAGVTELFRKQDIEELLTFMRRFLGIFSPIACRLLYVEDTREQRLALVAQLQEWGMQVDAFATADEAWQALQETHYDLVICDVVLSGRMSGSRLINRIRRLPGAKGNVPILAASAFDNPARRTELFYLGIDDYIAKPIAFMELRARIQTLLTRKKAVDRSTQLLQATTLGVVVVNHAGSVQSFDDNAAALFGCHEADVLGLHVGSLLCSPPPMEKRPLRWHSQAHNAVRGLFPAEISVVELDALSGARHFALLIRDLSEEHELAERLQHAKESAEQMSRTKSEFLANMSHEIRTPLNGVLGMAQIGLRSTHDPERVGQILGKIINSGKVLQGVIDDILDFSKIEAGKLSVQCQPMDVLEIVDQVVDLIRQGAEEKGLLVHVECSSSVPARCLGDPLRLRQILMNLLSNAVKFTERGQVSLRLSMSNHRLLFFVEDTGIGMDAGQLARLFHPFEQGDGSITRKYGGTGLGLVISQRLAELMAGEIHVESRLGAGSLFVLTLPVEILLDEAPLLPVVPSGGKRLAGLSILVAEDNEINQMIMEDNLRDEGAVLVIVENGQQAVDRVRVASPGTFDMVLMDVMMPVLDGYQATRQILALCPDLPVIGQTAHALGSERDACFAAGMVDHVAKPIDHELLVQTILKHLKKRIGP